MRTIATILVFLNNSGSWRVRVVGADYTLIDGSSIRAQLYYDSNDTGYYLNPNSTSNLWYVQLSDRLSLVKNRGHFTGINGTGDANGRGQIVVNSYYSDVVIASQQNNNNHGSTLSFTSINPSNSGDYRKFVINQGNWGGSHLLRFGWRNGSYTNPHDYVGGGFGGSYDVLGLDGSNNITYAFSQMRSPIYYDYNDTGYYVNPNGASNLNTATFQGGTIILRGGSPTLYLQDTNHRSSMIHCNSNLFYVLRGSGNDSTTWQQTGSYWPLVINLENNDAEFGRNIVARGTVTATSDIRLKTNIEPITNALDKVLNLRGVKYNRIDLEGQPKQIGVIA